MRLFYYAALMALVYACSDDTASRRTADMLPTSSDGALADAISADDAGETQTRTTLSTTWDQPSSLNRWSASPVPLGQILRTKWMVFVNQGLLLIWSQAGTYSTWIQRLPLAVMAVENALFRPFSQPLKQRQAHPP